MFNATTDAGLGMAPEGRFKLRFSDQAIAADLTAAAVEVAAKEAQEFACGAVGTERISVAPELVGSLMLDLRAGCPGAVTTQAGETALTDTTTTAWARLSAPGGELTYEAQPAGQAAWFVATGNDGGAVPMLPYLPIAVARIGDGEQAPFWPMVPLAGLERASSAAAPVALETTAIAPGAQGDPRPRGSGARGSRRTAARCSPAAAAELARPRWRSSPPSPPAGSRRASCARTASSAGKRSSSRGCSPRCRAMPEGCASPAAKGVVEPLRAALLTSQQFLVISDPAAIRPFFEGDDAQVTLRGWEFLLDPATWSDHGTILIVKNTPAAMQSLLGDTGAWTSSGAFNRNAATVSRRLLAIAAEARASLQDSRERSRPRRRRGRAARRARPPVLRPHRCSISPDWNGVLFLSAGLGRFPERSRRDARGDRSRPSSTPTTSASRRPRSRRWPSCRTARRRCSA